MTRFMRQPFEVVQNLPALEVFPQLPTRGARGRTLGLIRIGEMHNRDDHPARPDSAPHQGYQTALEIVAVTDQVERLRLNDKFAALQIRDACVDPQLSLTRALAQQIDRQRRPIHGRDSPSAFRQEQRMTSRPACEIQRVTRSKIGDKLLHQRRRRRKQLFAGPVALVPFLETQPAAPRREAALRTLVRIRTARSISFSVTMYGGRNRSTVSC